MGKKEFVVRRVFQLVVLYLAIASMLFFLFRAAPGSPLATFIGTGFTQAQEEAIRESFGLNDPLWLQYLKFLKNALLFDFGLSYTTSKPVMQLVGERVWNTLVLMGSSVVLAYLFGVPFGAYLAWNRGELTERVGVVFALVSRSAPVFWTGILGIWLFALELNLVPAGSMTSPGATFSSKFALYTSLDFWHHAILPAVVQAFYYYSLPALLMRNSMLEVMNEDFVDFAELKGISDRMVMLRHAARNALLPVVTAFAIAAGYAVGGSVIIETVFAWPGIGRLMVNSVVANNYPVAQGTFLILAVLVLLANFAADLAYGYIDPRITYE
ncbi:MAG: ABC transporter permease [Halobaculum sp.]|jgi:peptide/nickel transport system permease protein